MIDPTRNHSTEPAVIAIVGSGYRTSFFLRIAAALPDRFTVCGVVTRSAETGEPIEAEWGVPTFRTLDQLLDAEAPEYVVVSVPAQVAPQVITEATERGLPVLAETPPALDIASLEALDALVRAGARIQVAEQYHLEPLLSAQLDVARSGRLGFVNDVLVSVAHDYHGMSLLRRMLGIGFDDATVTAHQFASTIVAGPTRQGDPEGELLAKSRHVTARFDFGDRVGTYDFDDDQYRSWIRSHTIVARGERGELRDDLVRSLADYRSPLSTRIERQFAGGSGNHEGMFLRSLTLGDATLYTNPYLPARLADDDLAIAAVLDGMTAYVRGGPQVYSLAEASQDFYLQSVMRESIATGQSVRTTRQVWAPPVAE
ncbi:Gfo/Idh/MocA family protein [Marisediminicola senii]|uniref:Gfo/Idh/MocA family protein n=1 Tax=Marisediminicola senii TaxID=2711233 RepID=UPI001F19BE5F|nr:Gfo/Idh/MocA family oxidoreductase [Marisediminicola senii]